METNEQPWPSVAELQILRGLARSIRSSAAWNQGPDDEECHWEAECAAVDLAEFITKREHAALLRGMLLERKNKENV